MRKRRQLRGSRTAAAVLALAFVAVPVGATAHQPDDDCRQAEAIELSHELLVAALEPAPAAAPNVAELGRALAAANVVVARRAERDHELSVVVARRAERDRELSVRLEQLAHERVEISSTFERLRDRKAAQRIHSVMAWDREADIDRVVAGDLTGNVERLDLRDQSAGPWELVADAIVTAAHIPARAGIVIKHLVSAAAKLTPRVARALF